MPCCTVQWAQATGFVMMSDSAGTSSVLGVAPITVNGEIAMAPDIAGHINGGTMRLSEEDVEWLLKDATAVLQLVQAGKPSASLNIQRLAAENDVLARPSGSLGQALHHSSRLASSVLLLSLGVAPTVAPRLRGLFTIEGAVYE